jgi:hypothetical protein
MAVLAGVMALGYGGLCAGSNDSGSSGGTPTPQPATVEQVVFMSNYITSTGGTADLKVISADGTNASTLASNIIEYDLSADGSRIMYIDSGAITSTYNYKAIPIGGGTSTLLDTVSNYMWQISKDGTKLVYYTTSDSSLKTVAMTGGAPVTLATNAEGWSWKVSANSAWVVYLDNYNSFSGTGTMKTISINGGIALMLDSDVQAFEITPDSTKIIYLTGTGELHVILITGGTHNMLASNSSGMFEVSNDSAKVSFLHSYDINTNTYSASVVPVNGGTVQLLDTGVSMMYGEISPDSTRALYMKNFDAVTFMGDVYMVPLSGGTPARIAQNVAGHFAHATADSSKLVFSSDYSATNYTISLKVVSITGGTPATLATGVNSWVVSPRSDRVVYMDSYNSSTMMGTLKVVPLSGAGTPTTLATNVMNMFIEITP